MSRLRPILTALSLAIAAAGFASPASASCEIGLTLHVPRDFVALNIPNPARSNHWVDRGVVLTLETQRRTGGWQPARLVAVMPSGWERHANLGAPRSLSLGAVTIPGYDLGRTSVGDLAEIVFLRANLQGVGCVADRQFRIRYGCRVAQSQYRRDFGRAYPESIRTVVLFNGNRVAPRDINHRLTCPPTG